jgi:hypothetical protein
MKGKTDAVQLWVPRRRAGFPVDHDVRAPERRPDPAQVVD